MPDQTQNLGTLMAAMGIDLGPLKTAASSFATTINNLQKQVDTSAQKASDNLNRTSNQIRGLSTQVIAYATRWLTVGAAIGGVAKSVSFMSEQVRSAINDIDSLRINTIQIAAQIATMQGPENVGKNYKDAVKYATELNEVLEEIDARSFANAELLRSMNQAMVFQGVLLDKNNKSQLDAFVALSNAIAASTVGQNQQIQAYQEIRSLLTGNVNMHSQLAMQIDSIARKSGQYANGLKDIVRLGREHGDTLQRLTPFLIGINEASGDIQNTWEAIKSSIDTATRKIKRDLFTDFYRDSVYAGQKFSQFLQDNTHEIAEWIRSLASAGPSLNPITLALNAIAGRFAQISRDAKEAQNNIKRFMKDGVEYVRMKIDIPTNAPKTPIGNPEDIEKVRKEMERLQKSWNDFKFDLGRKVEGAGLSGVEKELFDLKTTAIKAVEQYRKIPGAVDAIAEALIRQQQAVKDNAAFEEIRKQIVQEGQAAEEAGKKFQSFQEKMYPVLAVHREYLETIEALTKAGREDLIPTLNEMYSTMKSQNLKDFLKDISSIGGLTFSGRSFSNEFASSFSEVATSVQALNEMYDEQRKIADELAEAKKQAYIMEGNSLEDIMNAKKRISALEQKDHQQSLDNIQSQLAAYGQLFYSVGQMFDENSRARKALHYAEMAATTAEIAMQVEKNIMIAIGAVLQQGTGDPYSAFARMAAMAAAVAGILAIGGIAFGGSSGSVGASSQSKTFTTALGSTEASQSVSKSFELLKDTYDMELEKLTGIYNQVKELNQNITGLVSSILRTGNLTTLASGGYTIASQWEQYGDKINSWFDSQGNFDKIMQTLLAGTADFISIFLPSVLGDIGSFLFGGEVRTKIEEYGIFIGENTINELVAGLDAIGSYYQDFYKKKSGGLFGSTSRSYWTEYPAFDEDTQRLMTAILSGLGNTMVELAASFGIDTANALNYAFGNIEINLKDMDAEEMTTAINEAISALGDQMVSDLFGGIVKQYQQIDEGLLETAVRLARDKETVLNMLEAINKPFTGTAESAIALSEALIYLAGDLDALTESISSYYDKFFTDAEKQQNRTKNLIEALVNQGFNFWQSAAILGSGRSSFRELIESIDDTTDSGQRLITYLLSLSDSFDEFYSYMEDRTKEFWSNIANYIEYLEDIENQRVSLGIQLLRAQGETEAAVFYERLQALGNLDKSLWDMQIAVWEAQDANEALTESLQSQVDIINEQISSYETIQDLLNNISGEGELADVQSMEYFRMRYDQLLAEANAGIDPNAVSNLVSFTEKYLEYAKKYGLDYSSLVNSIREDLMSLQVDISGGKTLTDLYNQLVDINDQLSNLKGYASGTMLGSGLSLVGERGAELVNLGHGSRVYSNSDTEGIIASAVTKAIGGISTGSIGPITLNLHMDRKQFGKAIIKEMKFNKDFSGQMAKQIAIQLKVA